MLTAAAAPLADATALGAITAEEARTGRGQHAALQLVIDECAFAMFIYESLKGLSEIIHRALAELPLGECRVAFLRVYWYTSYVAATSSLIEAPSMRKNSGTIDIPGVCATASSLLAGNSG